MEPAEGVIEGEHILFVLAENVSSERFVERDFELAFRKANQLQPAELALPNSTAFAQYRIFASIFTYAFTPCLFNEFRFGFTLQRDGHSNPFDGTAFDTSTSLPGLAPKFLNGIPHIGFNKIISVGSRFGFEERSHIFEYLDNVTLQLGSQSIRLGADIRCSLAIHRGWSRLG